MTFGLTLLETAAHELPIPPWAYGVIAFGLLGLMMVITLALGKGRPHS
jgi:hypothetical protein